MSNPSRDRVNDGISALTLIEDADNLLTAAWRTLDSPRHDEDRQAARDTITLANAHIALADAITNRLDSSHRAQEVQK